jgi:SAM-dependent methyltransferase
VVDAAYDDPYLASLYDLENGWGADNAFYLGYVRSARDVVDNGCGTGVVLAAAQRAGHQGRLVGLDPAAGMLAQARRHFGVEWRQTTLVEAGYEAEFDLVIMTGHAFQELLGDDEIRAFLAAAARALRNGGRLAFETRNPLVRAWEQWNPDQVFEFTDPHGRALREWHEVLSCDEELVTFTETVACDAWPAPKVSRSTLRFLPAQHLDHLLCAAGFGIDERYGDWDRSLMTPTSREIITIARRAA